MCGLVALMATTLPKPPLYRLFSTCMNSPSHHPIVPLGPQTLSRFW